MLRTRLQAEQRVEPIFKLQLVKLVAAAHVFAIDKDLRYFAIAVRAGHLGHGGGGRVGVGDAAADVSAEQVRPQRARAAPHVQSRAPGPDGGGALREAWASAVLPPSP